MHLVAAYDDAPRLPVHGGGAKTHRLQRIPQSAGGFFCQRPVERSVKKHRGKRQAAVSLHAPAHDALAQRHLFCRVAQRGDAGHEFPALEAGGGFKRAAVHRAGDPGRSDPARRGKQHDALHGIAERRFRKRRLPELTGQEGVGAHDHRAGKAGRFCVQRDPVDRKAERVVRCGGKVQNLPGVLRAQGRAVKGAHASSFANDVKNCHIVSPSAQPMCSRLRMTASRWKNRP